MLGHIKLPDNDRFRYILKWRTVLMLLGTNSVIVLFFFLQELSKINNIREFLLTFLYIQLLIQPIGLSIAILSNTIAYERIHLKIYRHILYIPVAVIAGWIGFIIGKVLIFFVFGETIHFPQTLSGMLRQSSYFLFFAILSAIFYSLKENLKETAKKLAEKEIQEQKLKQSKIEAELDALRAKVNPHFLFNTLNSIASLIPQDPEAAEDMVGKLAALFRHALDSERNLEITLSEEIEVIEKYLEIEKIRLGDRLSYKMHMDAALSKVGIPPLLLQPLVENAVKHGIAPKTDGGMIEISCETNGDNYRIQIRDSGVGYNPSNIKSTSYGMKNVCERLERFYPHNHHFAIHTDEGTTITIQLPIKFLE